MEATVASRRTDPYWNLLSRWSEATGQPVYTADRLEALAWALEMRGDEKPEPALTGGGAGPVTTGDAWLDEQIAAQWAAMEFDSSAPKR